MSSLEAFRAQFPVLANVGYLNAGTEGPIPSAAVEAVRARIQTDAARGRIGKAYFELVLGLADELRAGYAAVLGATPEEVALTGSTTDGCNVVLGGLSFAAGDEVLTSDQEHPGLLAPLRRLAISQGVKVRTAPFAELAQAVTAQTKLIACSHVSWVGGEVVDVSALVATGVPVLLDAAQGIGAVPVDVATLGIAYYAASGQKWLCGPEGSGCLYVRADMRDTIEPPWQGYSTIEDHDDILHSQLKAGAGRLDIGFPAAMRSAWALASLQVLADAGWGWIHQRSADLAQSLAARLSERGLTVAPRGRSTLVSWTPPSGDVEAEVVRFSEAGLLVRSIPSHQLVRASIGGWTSESEVERLIAAAA
jgi:L-cysteine/cystine lyase